jgi:hypothetical protein
MTKRYKRTNNDLQNIAHQTKEDLQIFLAIVKTRSPYETYFNPSIRHVLEVLIMQYSSADARDLTPMYQIINDIELYHTLWLLYQYNKQNTLGVLYTMNMFNHPLIITVSVPRHYI